MNAAAPMLLCEQVDAVRLLTVNRADLYDIYKLVLDKDRTHYRLDGQWLPLEKRTVTLPVRVGPLVLPIRKTVWRTRHGPAMLNDRGGFAMRYAGIDGLSSLTQYYRLTKARTFAEWTAAMRAMAGKSISARVRPVIKLATTAVRSVPS